MPPITITRFHVPLHSIPGSHRHSATSLLDVINCDHKRIERAVLNCIIDGVSLRMHFERPTVTHIHHLPR